MTEVSQTYCAKRLALYGITDEFNHVELNMSMYDPEAEDKTRWSKKKYTIFEATEADDIKITYLHLTGHQTQFRKEGNKWPKPYTRIRLNPKHCREDQKYTQEAKSGVHIFLNPSIITKYQKSEKIKTLFMTEGEFKSHVGWMNGLDIIGLPSIHAYKQKDTDQLHDTIREIIRVCQVEELVMIYDADIHSVKWEKWERNDEYDLGKRANLFFASARNIRDYAKQLVKDVYLCHLAVDNLKLYNSEDSVKGLDDLYLYYSRLQKAEEVTAELKKLRSSNKMFSYFNITAESPARIREFFRLRRDKQGKPDQFYNLHQSKIRDKEFVFLGFRYKYNNIEEGLEVVKHPDSEKFIRVACDYIKVITIPEIIRGIKVTRRKLEPWKSGEITRDYVLKGYKNFFDTIKKYDQFSVFPNNTEEYRQVVDNCFNMYYKVNHTPKEGPFPTIQMFLLHLFAEQIDMAYDYLQLMYTKPWQPLPIVALVSEERGTGKTKFLELLREIFCENATILGNDAITDNYNDDYASKLIIGIDEGLIEKKATVEKIKSWSTAVRIKMNTKFMSRQEIPFYGKIIITSNNTDSFIQIEDQETRFWVRKIPKIDKEDPELMEKMEKEIPAFLHYLSQREMKHEKKTRQWFANDLLRTEALNEIMDNSQSWLFKELKTLIEEEFYKYSYHCLSYTLTEIMELLNNRNAGAKFRASEARKYIEKKFKSKSKLDRVKFPNHQTEGITKSLITKNVGRYYRFYIENFLDHTLIKEIGYDVDTLIQLHTDNADAELWPNQKYVPGVKQEALNFNDNDIHAGDNKDLPF